MCAASPAAPPCHLAPPLKPSGPLWLVMRLGSLGAVFAVAALAALFRLALELLAAGLIAYYRAIGLNHLAGRPRPAAQG